MRLIRPSFEILTTGGIDILYDIEAAGRTCYKSEAFITDQSARLFVQRLIKRGHESVLEHKTISVRVICDRGVSHELVRHRIASYSQESTRYCDYKGDHITFVIPPWVYVKPGVYNGETALVSEDAAETVWINACMDSEYYYDHLRKSGWSPQQARSVLPNSLKTEIVMTMNIRSWRHFFRVRALGETGKPHPQMVEIAEPMLAKFQAEFPVLFDDIGEKDAED